MTHRYTAALILTLTLLSPGAALAGSSLYKGEYDPNNAGHPLKLAYYILYPVGGTLDYLIYRPAWHIGQVEPFRTLFGVPEPVPEIPVDEEAAAELR